MRYSHEGSSTVFAVKTKEGIDTASELDAHGQYPDKGCNPEHSKLVSEAYNRLSG
ncbi:hypothetical protein FRB93_010088 [Tulasnella sp. JGI-2019a]|nr:hypothetical protein FRB93_010088 [Tulasnella sp. JGI-2019a]